MFMIIRLMILVDFKFNSFHSNYLQFSSFFLFVSGANLFNRFIFLNYFQCSSVSWYLFSLKIQFILIIFFHTFYTLSTYISFLSFSAPLLIIYFSVLPQLSHDVLILFPSLSFPFSSFSFPIIGYRLIPSTHSLNHVNTHFPHLSLSLPLSLSVKPVVPLFPSSANKTLFSTPLPFSPSLLRLPSPLVAIVQQKEREKETAISFNLTSQDILCFHGHAILPLKDDFNSRK